MCVKKFDGIWIGLVLVYVIFSPALVGTGLKNYFVFPLFLFTVLLTKYRACVKDRSCVLMLLVLLGWLFFSPISVFFVGDGEVGIFEYFEQVFRILVLMSCVLFVISRCSGLDRYLVCNVGSFFVVSSLALYVAINLFPSVKNLVFFLFYNHSDSDVFLSYMLDRPGLWIGNPNSLALVSVLFFVYFLVVKEMKFRLFMMAGSVFIVLVTQSRTGLVCMVFAFFLWSIFEGKIRSFVVSFSVFCLIFFVSVWLEFVDIEKLVFRYYGGVNLAGRDEIWEQVFVSLIKSGAYVFGYFVLPGDIDTVDSEYFNVLARYGLVGLVLFLSVFICSLLFSFNKISHSADAKIGFLLVSVFLVSSLASSPLTSLKLSIIFIVLYSLSFSNCTVQRGNVA
ncbi:hypothetical protein LL270_12055 [Pseudomonas aestusnigri]|uniref:O-antigen ligase family protein n=1 Tax=Halopseudomonas aestusnigri TaxID=857252 RepID=UPI001D1839A1|nr:hypothetical protein [Halopseudomonas aestusnigri]MCC4261392.1 hypothetical protein [Halopseudomonas aestusnigri]|tara:strand:- start:4092 stop:5270 length:1179 start_codon:yes stop_codon:yes gene_type:complete